MNGAVQGAATTTARTPVNSAPIRSDRAASPCPTPWAERPISNTPDRFSATASMISVTAATTPGV